MTFEPFRFHRNIVESIKEANYTKPTEIQEKTIPIVLEGEDLVGCAQTGTGKTAAFAIPILNYLIPIVGSVKKKKYIRTVVLAPTRELALQIEESFNKYGKYTNCTTLTIYGGVPQATQVEKLKEGIDILIATPGRFLDLNKQGVIDINHLHHLVIDEADLMLDMGFINDVRKITKIAPQNRQTLLFSATMPIEIREIAEEFLKKPKYVEVKSTFNNSQNIIQSVYFVEKSEKKQLLLRVIKQEKLGNTIIFVRTKQGAENLAEFLRKNQLNCDALHGDKSQNARQKVLEDFKNKTIDFLIATDVASRGIDIDQLPVVINYDLPNIPETYIHRIGRTGRAGHSGIAISFCGKDEELYWKDIVRLLKNKVTIVEDHPFPWKSNSTVKKRTQSSQTINGTSPKQKNLKKSRKSDNSKKNKKRWY
ncbi:ATP-dependent helicase [Flavobacterium columnare]|uniref:DEAD-box ATP dependent DNA helicase n=2 Tax=Flavobacterium columnare TaxID=996 RepID=G8X5D4_FLACA|nr:DEAD/DEAH box helicase [Flavobacterium columnare]AEW86166.1 DEAD-box ATP dependent DNA helicase [Flavobacterium columnare ATCC 49512]AMO19883.1 DEAD/DEAH box helicase [Flavobacterium columnare]ANO48626.1 DEAD-box ATP dependent DNA helicase [Flavobacterium columnare]APT23332.1 RNA helicase [Flavobacterium columnare]AUX17822.1 RNA helicase [Flavobacterium columnare]